MHDVGAEPLDWPRRLAAAREESRAAGGAVLDALLHSWTHGARELTESMLPNTGVDALLDGAGCVPTFDVLDGAAARELQCVMVEARSGQRLIAAMDPWDESLPRRLRAVDPRLAVGWPLVAARAADMRQWLRGEATQELSSRGDESERVAAVTAGGPIVAFVDKALLKAMSSGASDVHFECDRSGVTVKHRLDGVLFRVARLEGVAEAQEVISRIKVLAQLDITERRLPQDGRFHFVSAGQGMDLRVSIMPSVHGEDAVLRLLDKAQWRQSADRDGVNLGSLGFSPSQAMLIRRLALEPSGMLLVTGPTGSGKTTTLYAVLSEINTGIEKIVTIEDPVEYELDGVLQIPVNERKGLTFARGLRSILRHDPDRILVGEIRDAETAEIAVQASLTGHQVFTTVHANSVADVMGRFRHFGLDMFGFTSSLNGLVVQRLLRRLCPHCSSSAPPSKEESLAFERHGLEVPASLGVARGCERCRHSGYAGRFVLAEIHRVDNGLRELIGGGAALSALQAYATAQGVQSLQHDGLLQVSCRQTTMEELRRVVGGL